MTFETGLDEIGLEMKRAANSRLRGDEPAKEISQRIVEPLIARCDDICEQLVPSDVQLDLCVLKLSQQQGLLREAYGALESARTLIDELGDKFPDADEKYNGEWASYRDEFDGAMDKIKTALGDV